MLIQLKRLSNSYEKNPLGGKSPLMGQVYMVQNKSTPSQTPQQSFKT